MQPARAFRKTTESTDQLTFAKQISTEQLKEKNIGEEDWKECNVALSQYKDLVSDEFKPWYCKKFYELGAEKFHQIAGQARHGKNPRRLFSYLLKK